MAEDRLDGVPDGATSRAPRGQCSRPDLVTSEIATTSNGADKMEMYRHHAWNLAAKRWKEYAATKKNLKTLYLISKIHILRKGGELTDCKQSIQTEICESEILHRRCFAQ